MLICDSLNFLRRSQAGSLRAGKAEQGSSPSNRRAGSSSEAYFLLELEIGVVNDHFLVLRGPVSTAEGSHSLAAMGHMMNFDEFMSETTDTVALIQREHELRALTSAGIGAEEVSGSGVNQEVE
ncbi:hypothetical protein Dimus_000697 [Dionaea muscipula]